jgi:hypothetical protein
VIGHVFDETGFAATGRTLEQDREPAGVGGAKHLDLIPHRQIKGLLLDAILLAW